VYRRRSDVAAGGGVGAGATPADRGVRGRDIGGVGSVGVPGSGGRRLVGNDATADPPIVRGEGAGGARRAVVDPGVQPDRRNPTGAVTPGGGGGEAVPARRGVERRPESGPSSAPGDAGERRLARPLGGSKPSDDSPSRGTTRGTYTSPSDRREAEPRGAEPATRREAAPPRSEPRAEPRAAEPRRESPPPRSEPRGGTAQPAPRSEPRGGSAQPAPRSEPQRSNPPRSSPEPRLERRRPETD
jgi:hypothetical protein